MATKRPEVELDFPWPLAQKAKLKPKTYNKICHSGADMSRS
jgi:hypothetical protein